MATFWHGARGRHATPHMQLLLLRTHARVCVCRYWTIVGKKAIAAATYGGKYAE